MGSRKHPKENAVMQAKHGEFLRMQQDAMRKKVEYLANAAKGVEAKKHLTKYDEEAQKFREVQYKYIIAIYVCLPCCYGRSR